MNEADQQLKLACARILSGHRPLRPDAWLRALADRPEAERPADFYGTGGAVEALEARTAALLGKETGLFVIKGVIAQLAVMKVCAERAGTNTIAFSPLGHIDMDEGGAVEKVAGLSPIRLGRYQPFGVAELDAVTEPLAALVVELPLRRAGYLLPPIDDLRAISARCRERGVHLHFDGARIWEAAAGYDLPLADLAALADSVYVSFYKGLGAAGGAMICGTAEFVRALPAWKGRFGGNLFTAFPYALGALDGLDRQLPRMADFVGRARALAARLAPNLLLNPPEPHVNSFHLFLPGSTDALTERNRSVARAKGVWLFNHFAETSPLAGRSTAEVVIGDASDGWTVEEAASWIMDFANSAC